VRVVGLDELTGLAEYQMRLSSTAACSRRAIPRCTSARTSRATNDRRVARLTVALLDRIAPLVRARLGKPALPLATSRRRTWATVRKLAEACGWRRPPIRSTATERL